MAIFRSALALAWFSCALVVVQDMASAVDPGIAISFGGPRFIYPTGFPDLSLTSIRPSTGSKITLDTYQENGDDHFWNFVNGGIKIYGDLCMEVTDGLDEDGTRVKLSECSGVSRQQFAYEKEKNWFIWVGSAQDHRKCLDIAGNIAQGAEIQIWSCSDNNPNQKWGPRAML